VGKHISPQSPMSDGFRRMFLVAARFSEGL
jgi:hypothetical protein